MEHQEAIDKINTESNNRIASEVERIKKIVKIDGYYRYTANNTSSEPKKIISKIGNDNKYKIEQVGTAYIWDITKNPTYKNEWVFSVSTILISATLSLLVGILLDKCQSKQKDQELKLLEQKLEKVSRKLDSSLHTKK